MPKKKIKRVSDRESEFILKNLEQIKKIQEENKHIPYNPLEDNILQSELVDERRKEEISNKIFETYRLKQIVYMVLGLMLVEMEMNNNQNPLINKICNKILNNDISDD